MTEIEELLKPIPGENPAGQNLYYSPVFDKIREARRQEDSGPLGLWERDRKTADFRTVIKLAEDALKTKTKDLWLCAWLTEAWTYEEELKGMIAGLHLTASLTERFWDHLFPEIEDADLELRAAPLEWQGSYFDPGKGSSPIFALRRVSLTSSGLNWFHYQDSRAIGYEDDIRGNDAKLKARQAALEDGKTSPEDFDKQVEATAKAFYKQREEECSAAREALERLDTLCADRFGSYAPSTSPLRNALEEFANTVHILLLKKLETDPDPVPQTASKPAISAAPVVASDPVGEAFPVNGAGHATLPEGEISSTSEAALHVIAAAEFLRVRAPDNPVPYLVIRALRWGELRAAKDTLDSLLEAPSLETRRAVRGYASRNDWRRVLETAEGAMSEPCGRAWLDLQRYSVQACERLGYEAAAKAIRAELKTLLADFPQLPTATLNDDTGAANPETLNWLRQEGLFG